MHLLTGLVTKLNNIFCLKYTKDMSLCITKTIKHLLYNSNRTNQMF